MTALCVGAPRPAAHDARIAQTSLAPPVARVGAAQAHQEHDYSFPLDTMFQAQQQSPAGSPRARGAGLPLAVMGGG
eukprot:gene8281-39729_t